MKGDRLSNVHLEKEIFFEKWTAPVNMHTHTCIRQWTCIHKHAQSEHAYTHMHQRLKQSILINYTVIVWARKLVFVVLTDLIKSLAGKTRISINDLLIVHAATKVDTEKLIGQKWVKFSSRCIWFGLQWSIKFTQMSFIS